MSHTSADIAKTLDIDDCDEALASPQDDRDPMVGTSLLNRYRIEDILGEGGSSVIYRGVHTTIGRTVAIKMLRPELVRNGETVARFLREGRAACRVRHEHVVEATDFGVTPDGDVFLVMEYLEGEDLAALLEREGPLPWPRACAIALQICEAIDAAHAAGVIHRDITLQNCFRVLRERNPDYIKVIDFGIAKMCESSTPMTDEVGVTGNAEIFGTPEYMAPEQVRRTVDADARTDVYALGAVLYALVTGRLPLRGATALDTLVRQIYEDVVPPSQVVADLPPQLDTAILRALEKDPQARFQSMAELAGALEAVPIDHLDLAAANERPERLVDPSMTDLELPSFSDHDLRSEAPAERLIGPSAKHSIGMRWPMVAAAACGLLFAGATALDRQQAAPTEAAPIVQASALVSPPAPSPAAPVRVATPTPVTADGPAAQLPTSLPTTTPEHAIAVAVTPPSPPKPTKSWRRAAAGRPVAEPTPTPELSGAGLPAPELVESDEAIAAAPDDAADDAAEPLPQPAEAGQADPLQLDPLQADPAPPHDDATAPADDVLPVQRPTSADPFAPADPAEEIKDPFESR